MAEGRGLSYYYRVAVVLLTTPMAIAYGKVLNIFVLTMFFLQNNVRFCFVHNHIYL